MTELEPRTDAASLAIAVADYAATFVVNSEPAIDAARHCLIDALSRGFEALRDPDRASLVAPLVPGAVMPGGARIPGTSLELDPPQAAFCLGAMFCWLQDSHREAEAPSLQAGASLAAMLATADYRARKATMEGTSPPKVRDVLAAIVKAVEIQGVLAVQAGCDRTGSAAIHLMLLALAATAAADLGGTQAQIVRALSYACVDGGMSVVTDAAYDRAHRYWATVDAVSRAVRHACQAVTSGCSARLTPIDLASAGPTGGLLGAKASTTTAPLGTRMMERLIRQDQKDIEPLRARFRAAVDRHFPARQAERVKSLCAAPARLDDLAVNELLAALIVNGAH
jgi:2-methylcitrate dehydratase